MSIVWLTYLPRKFRDFCFVFEGFPLIITICWVTTMAFVDTSTLTTHQPTKYGPLVRLTARLELLSNIKNCRFGRTRVSICILMRYVNMRERSEQIFREPAHV